MKKILVSLFLLVFGLCLLGCDISDNTEKPSIDVLYSDWYNCAKLPSMEDPFAEVYDGFYSIEIDENNNVTFKSINQEQLNGTLEYEEKEYTFDIKITFENNEIAKGSLSISNDSPYLRFFYKGVNHCFSKSEALSKEEFELYRSEFNAFLRDSFNNNTYPSIEEVETNELYRQYTNFNQIDPCCNGPKIYVGANKVSVISDLEKGVITATYNDGTVDNINIYDIDNIVLVKLDGTIERLEQVQDGQCFLTDNHSLFYFECEHQWDEGKHQQVPGGGHDELIYICEYCGHHKYVEFTYEMQMDELAIIVENEFNALNTEKIIIKDLIKMLEDILAKYDLTDTQTTEIEVCVSVLEELDEFKEITKEELEELYENPDISDNAE